MYKVVKLCLETSHERLLIANCVHLWADPETLLRGGGGVSYGAIFAPKQFWRAGR